jgi:SPP1 family predicted phage head-tail adaptor
MAPKLGEMRWTIRVERRRMVPPDPHQGHATHAYAPVLTTRAHCKTMSGVSQFSQVVIGGESVTHEFTIRYTTIPIDVRDRVRDTVGSIYKILSVTPMDEGRQWMSLQCAKLGAAAAEVNL